jgi:asparagine synthase (glutamine-hydrolysing)
MCGICGFNWDDKKLIRDMAFVISHRGPDQEGYFTDKSISLGHKRLSIIDLSEKGKQPMFNEDESICIVFNGEIYNFQEIKLELEKKGHRFNSNSDTEVIIHAYEEYGHKCLKLFNGMFAFAIWDSNKKELFIARDRIGIKPLYYYFKDNKLIFASEIKSILQHNSIKRILNENCLKQVIYYAFPINGETFLKDINELKPGHFLVYSNHKEKKKVYIEKYWELNVNETNETEDFYVKKVEDLLFKSVKRRLISDVPLGVSLSGGIDSSILVAIASKLKEEPIKTFTIGFDIPNDEYNPARIVAEHCKTDHTEVHLEYQDLTKAFVKVLWHMEIPFTRPAILPVYYLSNKIKEQLTVSLLGEGADELFAGYNRYDAYSNLPQSLENENKQHYETLKKKIDMPLNKKIEYISSGVFNNDKQEFFKEDFLEIPKDINLTNTFGSYLKSKEKGSQLNKALLYELKTEIPYYQCKKIDKTSMANSHEIRVPYLDHELVEFAMTIPSNYKFYGLNKKIILQKIAKKLLPKEIAARKKLPLVVPTTDFFQKELISISDQIVSEKNLKKRSYYKIPRIRKLIQSIKNRKDLSVKSHLTSDNAFRQMLFLTNLEIWNKLFIENDNLKNPNLSLNSYV